MTDSAARGIPRLQRLLVVRLSAMGDIIHTLPAATALRRAFPEATLGWMVEERWAELLCAPQSPRAGARSPQRPLADCVHAVNTAGWRRAPLAFSTWQEMAKAWREVRGARYDAVVDFQGAIRSGVLARWAGAPLVYGDANPRESIARVLYNRRVRMPESAAHVVEQAERLADVVISDAGGETRSSVSPAQPEVEFPVDADADTDAKEKIERLTAGGKFAIMNPGAGWGAKMWPAERYGEVARELGRRGVFSLINFGPGEEGLAARVESAGAGAARSVRCSISELIALTRRARLFIGGDTGPAHLAAALKIPVVGIFGPTNPARNGPFRTRSIVLRSARSRTDHSRYREPEAGLMEVTAGEVTAAALKLLGMAAGESA